MSPGKQVFTASVVVEKMSWLSVAIMNTGIMLCGKIILHDWTAQYSVAGHSLYTQLTRAPHPSL